MEIALDDTPAFEGERAIQRRREPVDDAAFQYLQAVKAIGSDDPDKVLAYLKRATLSDMFTSSGTIRPDGRMVHDMYLMQVKTPSQSKYPWDYYKVLQTIRGDDAFTARAETRCALWK